MGRGEPANQAHNLQFAVGLRAQPSARVGVHSNACSNSLYSQTVPVLPVALHLQVSDSNLGGPHRVIYRCCILHSEP